MIARARLAVALVLVAGAAAAEPPKEAERAMRQVIAAQVVAWNRHDLEGFMAGYWRSPELTFFGGGTVAKGWDATLQRYRQRYQEGGREMGAVDLEVSDVTLLGPSSGLVRGRWHLRFSSGKEERGLTTLLFTRFSDGWKIVHDHSSSE